MKLYVPDSQNPFSSKNYWMNRYKIGGNSGSGSYGRLSVYKANFINEVVHRKKVKSVIELGSGDGYQTSLFSIRHYTGVDLSIDVVERSRELFSSKERWRFLTVDEFSPKREYGMSMSLDVLYHLVEDDVFERYLNTLFSCAKRFVLIYSSDHEGRGLLRSPHVLHRNYSRWVSENITEWRESGVYPNPFKRTESSNPRHTTDAFFRLYERI